MNNLLKSGPGGPGSVRDVINYPDRISFLNSDPYYGWSGWSGLNATISVYGRARARMDVILTTSYINKNNPDHPDHVAYLFEITPDIRSGLAGLTRTEPGPPRTVGADPPPVVFWAAWAGFGVGGQA